MKNWKLIGFISTAVIVFSIPLYLLTHQGGGSEIANKLFFTGSDKCVECHRVEYDDWKLSDHFHAMARANDSTVLGNFENKTFVSRNGEKTFFYKKNGKFFVKTPGTDGKTGDFEITHAFGYRPLQQYLVPFDNGRYQCLPIAWNTEKNEWFSLPDSIYKNENLTPSDWLYWTNNGQNWNGMCAECHSTNLKKNFNPETNEFHTTFSEINVGCESCHGPGSAHIDWANLPEMSRPTDSNFNLIVKTNGITNREYVENCMRCHSRRSQFENFEHGRKHLLDSTLPSLLTESYYPDGQIKDEDYVYASFIQSKMYDNDVRCNDCHNVHSGKLVLEGNALCAQCHETDIYDTKAHHFHKYKGEEGDAIKLKDKTIEVGEGALCVNCHMPGQYYMGVDFRRDHSIRIPRPDLTVTLNVPNACNQCHADKTPRWADNYITKWYGIKRKYHYGETFAKAREEDPSAEKQLIKISKDENYPLIVRATAVHYLGQYSSAEVSATIKTLLKNSEALIRENALRVYSSTDPEEFKRDLSPALSDSVKAVRAEAAIRLTELPKEVNVPEKYKAAFNKALKEYEEMNLYMADFPSGRLNLGVLYANEGDLLKAARQYEEAIKIDSLFFPAKMNLAIVYNKLGENENAEILLRDLVENHPELPDSYYYLGLLLAEKKDYENAAVYLKKAARLIPERARINYNAGLILQFLGKNKEAEEEFLTALKKEPGNFDFLYALAAHYVKTNEKKKAEDAAKQLDRNFPHSGAGKQILQYLNESE